MFSILNQIKSKKDLTILNLTKAVLIILFLVFIQISYANNLFYGSINPIPQVLQKEMIGNTWHTGCPIDVKDLSYLKLSYWGFDNKPHIGEIIINQRLGTEVLDIFKQLFDAHFPIEKIVIPENLIGNKKFSNAMDLLLYLVNSNDTYGFFCRIDTQTNNKPSPHSFGIAMDINPFYNPAVIKNEKSNQAINPKQQAGYKYLDRKLDHIGMIKENDNTFKIFLNHGWQWGGFFDTGRDYMHFQKVITHYYIINHLEYISPKDRIEKLPD